MGVLNRLMVRTVVLVLAVGLVTACGGKEERKAKYLERGKAYLADKNYDKARIEFKNVLQIDPKTAEAYLYLGQVEEQRQNWGAAFGSYKKASELNAELIEPRVRLARFYLAQYSALRGRKEESGAANALGLAQEQVKEILQRAPGNLDGLALQATLWVNEGEQEKAITQLERVIQKDPGLQSAAILLASLYDQKGRTADAESVLRKAIESSDEPIGLQTRLAQFYGRHEQNDKAEAVLRSIVAEEPSKLPYRIALASFLAQTDQTDKAEQVLRAAIEADPEDAQRYLLLAEFLAGKRSRDVAIGELQKIIAQKPELTDLQFGLVQLYLGGKQTDEATKVLEKLIQDQGIEPAGLRARATLAQLIATEDPESERVQTLIDEVLKENPRDNDALLLKGKLAAQRKDYVEAINDFRSVLKDQPNSAEVLRLLASAHLANGEPELARDTLARAVEANPDNASLRLMQARLLVQDKDIDAALAQIEEVLTRDQYQQQALAMKYDLLAARGDAEGMEAVVKQMQAGAPEEEAGYLGEARLRMGQKDYDAALAILDKILAGNPESVAALMAKSDALAAQKKFEQAIPVVEKLQQAQPEQGEGYYRKGKLLEQLGNTAGAIEQYELALQKVPESVPALTTLINLEVKQADGPAKAEKRLLAILKDNPQHRAANDLLGMLYMAKKDFARAEQAFQRQIEINPNSDVVYTQLAQARLAQDNPDGAVKALEKGLEVLPDSVRLLVSLAGARERQKDYQGAIGLYEKVLERQPGNAISTNNLAALLSDHRSDQASLDKAAQLAATLEKTRQPAFRDTAGWVYYRRGDYDKAVEILKGVVEKAPQVPVFQYHLGMAYLKQGDKAAARAHLGKAVGEKATYPGIDEARKALAGL